MFNTSQMGAGISSIFEKMVDESLTLEPLNEKFIWEEGIKHQWEKQLQFQNPKDRKLNFIIPIRDREKDLEHLISNLKIILKYQKIQYRIYIIEQSFNQKLFNKGKIINAAFKESLKDNFSKGYVIHDVDNIPLTKNIINYYYNDIDLKGYYGNDWYLGCIFYIPKNLFEQANGFSNLYWGWGFEDSDFQGRCEYLKFPINREQMIRRRKTNLIKDIETISEEKKLYIDPVSGNYFQGENLKKMFNYHRYASLWLKHRDQSYILNSINNDGLRNCEYKITKQYLYQSDKNIIRTVIDI
jgi:hypothetical protein